MSDVSSVTNLVPTVNEGFITTVAAPGVTSGATTIPLTSVTGLVNGKVFVGIIEPGATNQQVFTGTVDTAGSSITGVKWTRGTNAPHVTGVTIVDFVTGTSFNMIAKHLLTEHTQQGTHGAVTATSLSTSGNITIGGTATVTGATTLNGNLSVSGSFRSTPRAVTAASSATLTPNIDNNNIYDQTAQAEALSIVNPTGSPRNGDVLIFRIKDNGTARAITWGSAYQNVSGLDMLTTTTVSKWSTVGCMYESGSSKWLVVSITTEA